MSSNRQTAVITGAASGLGLELSRQCLQRDMNVVMADQDVTRLCDQVEILSGEYAPDVLGVVCDVSEPESVAHLVRQTVERFDSIQWVFNNAGISGHLAPIWNLRTEHIRKVLDINLFGVIHVTQAFLPILFNQQASSHIINISSVYGLCSASQVAAYAMSKQALMAFSESLYFDLKRVNSKIDVSVVCPSFINTALLENSQPLHDNQFHKLMTSLMERSRPAEDVAAHIIRDVLNKTFYILPDSEVKDYFQEKAQAVIHQHQPHQHQLEKLISALSQRAESSVLKNEDTVSNEC